MRQLVISFLLIALSLGAGAREKVGLVLSGGGSKGIAHIGFIQAMEENSIPIDYVTGTSMGAIVGSLYAAGFSPSEMMKIITSPQFMNYAMGHTSDDNRYEFNTPATNSQWLSLNLADSDSATIANLLPTSLINPIPMDFEFMTIYSPATGACNGDFNRLMVPLRTVASDVYAHVPVVFSHGELPLAVRSSMSFPLVFQPIMVNGRLLYDGGLYDVYPIDVMMSDFKPDRLVGVDVSTPNTSPGPNDLISQLENMVMTGDKAEFPDSIGVNVVFDLEKYGLMGWAYADTIYQIGYRRGLELADSLKSRISARRSPAATAKMRADFKKRLPELKFDNVTVSSTTPEKAEYIKGTFIGTHKGPMSVDEARDGYYNVTSTGRMRQMMPHASYDSVTGLYNLDLHADIAKPLQLGIGGYLTSGTQNMLYLRAARNSMSYMKPDWSVEGWAGPNYQAANAELSTTLRTITPQRLIFSVTASRDRLFETEKMFYDFTSPAFVTKGEVSALLHWQMAAGRHGIFEVNGGYGHLMERFRDPLPGGAEQKPQRITYNLVKLGAKFTRTTLNDEALPTRGSRVKVGMLGTLGRRHLRLDDQRVTSSPAWLVAEISGEKYFDFGDYFSLGANAEFAWSTQKLLTSYAASLIEARSYTPFWSMENEFDAGLRANQYLAAGITPVLKLGSMFQVRLGGQIFAPMRRILPAADNSARYSSWFGSCQFAGNLTVALKLPFGCVRGYVDYRTTAFSHWSCGISVGMLIKAPKFLKP